MRTERGGTLVELLVVLAVVGTILGAGNSMLSHARERIALAGATAELRAVLQRARMLAIGRDRNVGVRFKRSVDGVWTYGLYEDGDGDGLRNDDINAGRDRVLDPPRRFEHRPVTIDVPLTAVRDPLSGGPLANRLPVRFNNSAICSFSRNGEATNGSVVVTDGVRASILQVSGRSARIVVWNWNGERWRAGV